MDSLIRKLEEATGPSRELDAEIACARFPNKYVVAHEPFRPGVVGISCATIDNGHGYISVCDAPPFTSSLDAAATLVPQYFELTGPRKYLNIPTVVPDRWRAVVCSEMAREAAAWAPTGPLALVLASLKAIQSSKNTDTGRKQ